MRSLEVLVSIPALFACTNAQVNILLNTSSAAPTVTCSSSSSGSGSSQDPFIICNLNQLISVANNLGATYSLLADIDASSVSQWTPVGTSGTPFHGSFNGNNHTISNLNNSSGSAFVGLFGDVSGTVTNLNITHVTISSAGPTGALTAQLEMTGVVQNCSSSGEITAAYHGGGLVGYNLGSISNSSSSANISQPSAFNESGFGGLVGHNDTTGSINSSFAQGNVTITLASGSASDIGGLVGVSLGSISNSYATGAATGVGGAAYAGGLIGEILNGAITNCYSSGAVSSAAPAGGLIAANAGSVTSSYWATDSSGQGASAGGTPLTLIGMQTQSNFTNWDFSTPIWKFKASIQNSPVLFWQ